MLKKMVATSLLTVVLVMLTGCSEPVPPGNVGRIYTRSGWSNEVLKPGRYVCLGRDRMYLLNTTNAAFKESLNVLVGGKVNLKLDFSVRVKANDTDIEMMKKAFESVTLEEGSTAIMPEQLYHTFMQMKAQAVPREVYEVQPDIQTAVANSPKLAIEVRKRITEAAASTPLVVEDAEITNYDWPPTVTEAQNKLAEIQLQEEAASARVRADLKKAEGQLQIEEANKLVELKKAEAIAESIEIIKEKLARSPEYLMWHQIRVMGQAAMGPNNCFILYPFATNSRQIEEMVSNSNLVQMLHPDGPHPELKKNKSPSTDSSALEILPATGEIKY